MALRFECGECGKTLSVKDELAGKRVKCPCGAVVVAKAAAGPSLAATAARTSQPASARPAKSPAPGPKSLAPKPAGLAPKPAGLAPKPAGGNRAKPAALKRPDPNPYASEGSDLSDLFDELTESDLRTQGSRDQEAAEVHAAKVDPLAAYGDAKSEKSKRSGSSGSRPVGLTVLAVLNFIVAALAITLGMLFLFGDMLDNIEALKNIATTMAVVIIVAGVLCAAVAAGLLSGQPWGWWLGATAYAYNIFDRIFFLVFALVEGNPPATAFKGIGATVFAIGILAYLFNEDIRNYFNVKTKPAIAAAITFGSMVLFAFLIHLGLHLMVEPGPAE